MKPQQWIVTDQQNQVIYGTAQTTDQRRAQTLVDLDETAWLWEATPSGSPSGASLAPTMIRLRRHSKSPSASCRT